MCASWCRYHGGSFGQPGSSRISLRHTRAIVDAIHSGELSSAECSTSPVFGLQVPDSCTGVPREVLHPEASWRDAAEFDGKLRDLGGMFSKVRTHTSRSPPMS